MAIKSSFAEQNYRNFMKDHQDYSTQAFLPEKEITQVLTGEESLVTTGSNVFFNEAGLTGVQNFGTESLQWVYSVIKNGKILIRENQNPSSGQEVSLVKTFKRVFELAVQMEIARKEFKTLKQTIDSQNEAIDEQRKLEKANEEYRRRKRLYTNAKRSLPVFCWSGIFESGQIPKNDSLTKHSGRLQIDLDGLGLEQAREVRDLIAKDPHVEAAFLSPSRLGVKAAMLIPPPADDKEHKQAFLAAEHYLQQTYALKIDESCNDVRRLCYFSYDPDLISNEKAVPLDIENWIASGDDSSSKGSASEKADLSSTQQLPLPPSAATEASAQQYLEQGLKQIVSAAEGTRHNTYRTIAYTCGGYVSAGDLPREETLEKLVSAARKVRSEDPSDAERTVRECFTKGEEKPYYPESSRVTSYGNWHFYSTTKNQPPKRQANLHNVVEWLKINQKPIWYDEFYQSTFTVNEKGHQVEWDDESTLKLTKELQDQDPGWRKFSKQTVDDGVQTYAYEDKRNELTGHLDSLRWDGEARLNTWLLDYCGVEDNSYTREAGRCWLLAAVSRGYEPGTKFDHCLILQAKQGYFKSTLFSTIGGNWFCELQEFKEKDAKEKLRGKWIVEFAEMSALKKADNETIKSFITERADRYRPPWGTRARDFPRTCVFGGSTNEDEFLSDSTGNRRFWPISISKPIRIDEFKQDRDQLLAEAVHRYKAGEKFLLSSEARKIAEVEQEQVFSVDPWEASIRTYITTQLDEESVTADQLLEHLQGLYENKFQVNRGHRMRVGKVLQHLRWEKRRCSAKDEQGNRPYAYWPGTNAVVRPNQARRNQETTQGERFEIDNASPNEKVLTNRHLTLASTNSFS